MKKLITILIILVLIIAGLWYWASRQAPIVPPTGQTPVVTPSDTTTVSYACKANKSITASFTNGPTIQPSTPGEPPIPGGSAHIVLSDGRTLDLKQTLSADGVRYSDGDPMLKAGQPGAETFVFWSKGNGALVLENNVQKSYIGCVQAATDTTGTLPKVYTDEAGTFSIRLPDGYTVDESYKYQGPAAGKTIDGVKFTIPKALAAGTNLSTDSYVSVERLPVSAGSATTSCTADKFLDGGPNGATVQTMTDNGTTYSYLTSTDAAAGNRYEETVYAILGTSPCTAIRYMIHWGVFENYPAGSIKQFDEAALKQTFDAIRRSLVVNG